MVLLASGLVILFGLVGSNLGPPLPPPPPLVSAQDLKLVRGGGIPSADVSWPQCPESQGGHGLPMPPARTRFMVIGLTHGLPFTINPCLGSQVTWALRNRVPAHVYLVAAAPSSEQLAQLGANGPWPADSRSGQLHNYGYAQAVDALRTVGAASLGRTMVWIDVEPHGKQPWLTGTRARETANRQVLEGLFWAFAEAQLPYGLYSYRRGWAEITGSWQLPAVPVWATAGQDTRAAAIAMCRRKTFSGGPALVAQWYDDVRDSDVTCPGFSLLPPVPRPPAVPPGVEPSVPPGSASSSPTGSASTSPSAGSTPTSGTGTGPATATGSPTGSPVPAPSGARPTVLPSRTLSASPAPARVR